jgi:hypothetical protein
MSCAYFVFCDATMCRDFCFRMISARECISPVKYGCSGFCNCRGLIRRMGHSGAYITLSMINIMLSLFSWCIFSCTFPLTRAVRPPAMPFKVVFCIDVGWCRNASMYGATHHDTPESTMACDVSFVHSLVAISTAILSSLLFCKLDWFCRGKSSFSLDAASC